jgi:hypothetical protein
MKYIFRYALFTNFTTKQQQITSEQLTEALRVAKFSLAGRNIEELVEQANKCIELLLRNSDKKDLESIVSEAYQRQTLSEAELADIVVIWESEKHLIYKKMLSENTKSAGSYSGLGWSVRNSISAKNGTTQNAKTVNLRLRDNEEEMEVHCNRVQFQALSERLGSAQNFLSELFHNSQ